MRYLKTNAATTPRFARRPARALALAAAVLSLGACTQYHAWRPAPPPRLAKRAEPPPPPAPVPAPVSLPPMGSTPGSAEDFAVKVGDRVFFDFDSATLDAQAHATLDAQAAWLRGYPNVLVRIEGNTDERGHYNGDAVTGVAGRPTLLGLRSITVGGAYRFS